jgi:hypothetical protein
MRQASWHNEQLLPGRFYAVALFAHRIAVVTALPEKRASAGLVLRQSSLRGMSIVERNLLSAVREELVQFSLAIVRPDAHIARISL